MMDKQTVKRRMPRAVGAAAAAVTKFAAGDKTKIVVRGLKRFALCVVLSRAMVFGQYAPFGLAMAAALLSRGAGVSVIAGVFCGALLLHGAAVGAVYAAAVLLVLCVVNICGGLRCVKARLFAPTVATLAGAACTFVFLPVGQALKADSLLPFAAAQLLTGAACYVYGIALSPPSGTIDWRRPLTMLTLAATALMGVSDLAVFGLLSPARVVAQLIVLSIAYLSGSAPGAAGGVTFGAAMDLAAGGGGALFTCCYGAAGLLAGTLHSKNRGTFALMGAFGGLCASLMGIDHPLFVPQEMELICACAAFCALPPAFWQAVRQTVLPAEASRRDFSRRLRQTAGDCAGEAAQAFYELYLSVLSGISATRAAGDDRIRSVFDHASERVCRHCVLCSQCWQSDYLTTLSALNDVTGPMRQRGRAELTDFPQHFASRCVHLPELMQSINSALFALRERQAARQRKEEERTLLARQYIGVTDVLRQVGAVLTQDDTAQPLLEEQTRRYAAAFGWVDTASVFRDGGGRLVIELFGAGIDDILAQGAGFSAGLSALIGVSLTRPEQKEGAPGRRLVMRERAPLRVVVGTGRQAKEGETLSGDSTVSFLTEFGQGCFLLADGMGTGEAAARDSHALLQAMRRFLRAGVSPEDALKAIAPAYCLRADGTRFVTLDLLQLDLFSGRAVAVKCGAAPSYLRAGGVWSRMDGKALPVGLSEDPQTVADSVPLRLGHDDLYVILSDGVSDGRQDEWVRETLERSAQLPPKALAALLVEEASRRGATDDKTAMVMRVEHPGNAG